MLYAWKSGPHGEQARRSASASLVVAGFRATMSKTAAATSGATPAREVKMARSGTKSKRYGRRDFLQKSAAAAIATFAVARKAFAAEPVNIGGLYPVTGSFAQIGQGCVNAAKLAVKMVNDSGGIKSLGGAPLNLIVSDVQSDTTVTRTETDRLINGYKLSAIHGCFASALTL